MSKMTIEEDVGFTQAFPDELNCWMEIISRSGQRFTAETAYPKGHQQNPLSDGELEAKLQRLATGTLPEPQCRAALAQLWSLEHAPNLRQLFDSLVG
jgi:2-methylcitrate dehydratase PrpD